MNEETIGTSTIPERIVATALCRRFFAVSIRWTVSWSMPCVAIVTKVEVQTADESVVLIAAIKKLMQQYKQQIRSQYPKMYSQDLLNNLFKYPYTKIEFIQKDLQVSRNTAIRYLEALVKEGLLKKEKYGRDNFYLNRELFALLSAG